MSNKIGRFEIISQVAQSPFATVYKAQDPESQQTIALKVVALSNVLDRDSLVKAVFGESDRAKPLNSPNIAQLYGVGDEDGQLLAAAEYIQGNPIATTLERGDGFSIWDIQDIARQVCHALDHAQAHKVLHQSLEPAKIMVQWDGVVKVLGFGISSMNGQAGSSAAVPEVFHYVSPEQMRGEDGDHRSAIFSLGAILYEMATDHKAFAGETADQVRTAILESAPEPPHELKAKLGAPLGELIMKALSKSPENRYQSGQELIHDLEQCNAAPKKVTMVAPQKPKAQAAAAGVGPGKAAPGSKPFAQATPAPAKPAAPPAPAASAAAPATETEAPAPSFAIDPMMADNDEGTPAAAARKSFSELEELPPLKEIFVPSISPSEPAAEEAEPAEAPAPTPNKKPSNKAEEKPKIQVRAAAKKAATEIRNTPKQLYGYAIGGAVLLIVVIIAGMTIYNFFEDHDSGSSRATAPAPVQTRQKHASQKPAPPPAAPAPAPAPTTEQAAIQPPPPAEQNPSLTVTEEPEKPTRGSKHGRTRAEATPQLAKLTVASNPAGAQISFDGSPLCQSPCTLTDIAPGQHVLLASKSGYSSESRTINLKAGAGSSITMQLSSLSAMLSVSSTPAGGVIFVDGHDTGKLTPSQFIVNRPGNHSVVVRRNGYIEASGSFISQVGQTATVNLTLAKLGETDDIRSAGGKFKKLLNRGESASMGVVSIKTQPKGAQIMVNNRVLDKGSPFDFYLNPGAYVIDITMSGYRSVHKVINVEEGEKVAIEETLLPQ
ncbi:MAG TPA: serine/threonine-protein kinase [Terriglobales bacterium]|nr:serine/threonine-protein kinase [Terriglobales bacterium]